MSIIIEGFVNWIYALYYNKKVVNNDDNHSNKSRNNKYVVSFQSISFVHAYIGSFLNSADHIRYGTVFKSKEARINLYRMKTELTIPFYDQCYRQPVTLSRYLLLLLPPYHI